MHLFIVFFEIFLISVGIVFLIRSLFPMQQLIAELSDGSLQKRWKILSVLILFFVMGYVVFAYNLWLIQELHNPLSIVISFMLLGGGVFVFLVGQLALHTMSDIKKIASLKQESITDGLMGIKNRRYFEGRLCEEVAHSKRHKLPLSLLLLDVDHFKSINDTYGHQAGDEVLKNLSALVLKMVRDSDVVARYGGEEIAIIAPSTPKPEAELLAERLRNAIEKTTVATIGATQEVIQVTVSVGVSALGHVVMDRDALLEEADQALYTAKNQGRNKVISSPW
jgi:diguanylate cyclase (GGDEF)-like protein